MKILQVRVLTMILYLIESSSDLTGSMLDMTKLLSLVWSQFFFCGNTSITADSTCSSSLYAISIEQITRATYPFPK